MIDTINIIRRAFYYGKTKETCTLCTNDRRKSCVFTAMKTNVFIVENVGVSAQ